MRSHQVAEYYAATENSETREDLIYAARIAPAPKVAIDCGCGAGSDIAYLSALGFSVHGFDIEQAAIAMCRERFAGDEDVFLSQASFQSFDFFTASLIVADASLFFCKESEFDAVWHNIDSSLSAGAVFSGSFLGPEDSMATAGNDQQNLWPNRLVLNEQQVRARLVNYEVHRFKEHKFSGTTPHRVAHDWHIFSVVAVKKFTVKMSG